MYDTLMYLNINYRHMKTLQKTLSAHLIASMLAISVSPVAFSASADSEYLAIASRFHHIPEFAFTAPGMMQLLRLYE